MLENETGRAMASAQQHSLPFDALVESAELPSFWRPSFRRSKGARNDRPECAER
jgi:hypothetical protein